MLIFFLLKWIENSLIKVQNFIWTNKMVHIILYFYDKKVKNVHVFTSFYNKKSKNHIKRMERSTFHVLNDKKFPIFIHFYDKNSKIRIKRMKISPFYVLLQQGSPHFHSLLRQKVQNSYETNEKVHFFMYIYDIKVPIFIHSYCKKSKSCVIQMKRSPFLCAFAKERSRMYIAWMKKSMFSLCFTVWLKSAKLRLKEWKGTQCFYALHDRKVKNVCLTYDNVHIFIHFYGKKVQNSCWMNEKVHFSCTFITEKSRKSRITTLNEQKDPIFIHFYVLKSP